MSGSWGISDEDLGRMSQACADWWIACFYNPDGGAKFGDARLDAMEKAARNHFAANVDVDRFYLELLHQYDATLREVRDSGRDVSVFVFDSGMDYRPYGPALKRAMQRCDVCDFAMPFKASLLVYRDRLEGYCGYGNPTVVVWRLNDV